MMRKNKFSKLEIIIKTYWNLTIKNDYLIIDYFKKYISFVALGTISDIMPLLSDNRFLVRYGIHNLKNTKISLTELSKIYGIHQSQIGKINKGLAYHNATIQYPIRIIKYKRKSS